MYGSLLGGADRRVSAYVLIAGTKSFSDWYLLGRKLEGDARAAVVRELAPLDPAARVGDLAPSPVLFQFGTQDHFVPAASADAFFAGATEPEGDPPLRLRPRDERRSCSRPRGLGEGEAGPLTAPFRPANV